jgi:hypothetical protein
MAEAVLVTPDIAAAQDLVRLLDQDGFSPRAALWAVDSDSPIWKLWVVPPEGGVERLDFYRRLGRVYTENRDTRLPERDSVRYVTADDPAIVGLSRLVRAPGITSVTMTSNAVDGRMLPDSVVIRMDL